jgi:hypothetical protein
MFASTELAARIEGAETRLTESLGRATIAASPGIGAFVERIAGGVAAYAGPSSPMNKMIGVGFDGVPTDEDLLAIERRFGDHGEPLQAEVATLADPGVVARLSRRGYVLQNFENVSGRPIEPRDADPRPAEGVTIDLMEPEEAEAWLDASIVGFQHPDDKGVPADALPPREAMEASMRPFLLTPGFQRYCARIGGRLAGVASSRIDNGVLQLCGAATLPAFRRRGAQGSLLRRRLADGLAAGCDVAVMTTQPGSTSQQNGHRQSFALLYTRAVMVLKP